MVTPTHPIEARLFELVSTGENWGLDELGGIDAVAAAARTLGSTRIMPELLEPLVRAWKSAATAANDAYEQALRELLAAATVDFVIIESVDILESQRPLPNAGDEICLTLFLAKASDSTGRFSGLARGAALDGAFRWSQGTRRLQYGVLSLILGVSAEDDPEYLRRVAKIAGVAFSHWRDKELVPVLKTLAQVDGVRHEAAFELGMATLVSAMESTDREATAAAFDQAGVWFGEANAASESDPAAELYADTIGLLLSFKAGDNSATLEDLSKRVQRHAFDLHAASTGVGPPWLGARHSEAVCWSAFASDLVGLSLKLEEPTWWEPALVVEHGLLSVYNASRSILHLHQEGGVEAMLRPRINASVAAHSSQAYLVRRWLSQNATHEWQESAQQLIREVDQLIASGSDPPAPFEAASEGTSLAALIERSQIPEKDRRVLSRVVGSALSLQVASFSGAEAAIIEQCCLEARRNIDYTTNPDALQLFDTVLLWLVRFVATRLEMTRKNDPSGAYLFERADGTLPHEDELQHDFFWWLTTNVPGTELEPNNVGSGRADIRLRSGPERLVIEVKREEKDASFDSLATAYAAQTTDYQNVSIRLGILLVLDLTTQNREGTPHITSLFETRHIQRTGEAQPRLVLIAKVPGRRVVPSELTRRAKQRDRRSSKVANEDVRGGKTKLS
mgnify:CR=1 FL=1